MGNIVDCAFSSSLVRLLTTRWRPSQRREPSSDIHSASGGVKRQEKSSSPTDGIDICMYPVIPGLGCSVDADALSGLERPLLSMDDG